MPEPRQGPSLSEDCIQAMGPPQWLTPAGRGWLRRGDAALPLDRARGLASGSALPAQASAALRPLPVAPTALPCSLHRPHPYAQVVPGTRTPQEQL